MCPDLRHGSGARMLLNFMSKDVAEASALARGRKHVAAAKAAASERKTLRDGRSY